MQSGGSEFVYEWSKALWLSSVKRKKLAQKGNSSWQKMPLMASNRIQISGDQVLFTSAESLPSHVIQAVQSQTTKPLITITNKTFT